ncbi:hypothetical protein Z043_115189, partial [Scleropages formosus]
GCGGPEPSPEAEGAKWGTFCRINGKQKGTGRDRQAEEDRVPDGPAAPPTASETEGGLQIPMSLQDPPTKCRDPRASGGAGLFCGLAEAGGPAAARGGPAAVAGAAEKQPDMGNTASCCVASSPKLRRKAHARLDSDPEPEPLSREDTGWNLQHISDRENVDDLNMEYNPSDHPRASTLFLSKSQTDVRDKRKSLFTNHHHTGRARRKHSSCSTIFLDDNTVSQPNLKHTIKCVALAIYYHIKNRDPNDRTLLDIFDEKLHPLSKVEVPPDYDEHDPEQKHIYRFVRTLFSAAQLTA